MEEEPRLPQDVGASRVEHNQGNWNPTLHASPRPRIFPKTDREETHYSITE